MKKKRNEEKDMTKDFFEALDILEKERKISKEYLLKKIKDALATAYKKETKLSNISVNIDEQAGKIKVCKVLTVYDPDAIVEEPEIDDEEMAEYEENGEATFDRPARFDERTGITLEEAKKISPKYQVGDVIEIEIKPKNFGRISIQNAKQMVVQAITEAEKGNLVQEYEDKKGQILPAIVTRTDPLKGIVILDINGNEISLPRSEQIPGEVLNPGDRVKIYVSDIRRDAKRSSVIISRASAGLIEKLFELEIPEIQDGTVLIKSIAREAGSRTKVAVYSTNEEVDPIGACIGPKGIRKNTISAELGGEKIDIIKYSENAADFIASALAPAKVNSVTLIDEETNSYRVMVDEDQLSLAIGVKGQNARLAVRLTQCSIDIKSESLLKASSDTSSLGDESADEE
jgi:N utilization substance protein A